MLAAPGARVTPLPEPTLAQETEVRPAEALVARGTEAPSGDRVEALLKRLDRSKALTAEERRCVAATILEASAQHGVSPHLVMAVIHVESAYNPFAVSQVGALGLMQVMPLTGAEVAERIGVPWRGRQTLFDPEANVRIGVAYLKELLDRYGSIRVALAAYNWGPGRIDTRLRRGTTVPAQYAERVMGAFSRVERASVGS